MKPLLMRILESGVTAFSIVIIEKMAMNYLPFFIENRGYINNLSILLIFTLFIINGVYSIFKFDHVMGLIFLQIMVVFLTPLPATFQANRICNGIGQTDTAICYEKVHNLSDLGNVTGSIILICAIAFAIYKRFKTETPK